MINLIRSEVLKIRSTQVWIWMLVLAVVFTGLITLGTSADSVHQYKEFGQPINYYDLFTTSTLAAFALMVLGILGLTTEYRHKTITPTLLATPNRWMLLAGKVASYFVFSIIYSIVCITVNFAVAIIWLSAKDVPLEYGHGVAGGVVKAFISLVLLGIFGLGIGALIRNQAAAMVFGILYFTVLNILLSSIPVIRKVWLFEPGGAIAAFTSNGTITGLADDVHVISPMAGLAVLVVWCVVILFAGATVSLNRDVS
jgi:ABC-2 type transport system permease protein